MLRSNYQTVRFFQQHRIEQETARQKKAAVWTSLVERISAFTTRIAKGLERYWNVPASESQIKTEPTLFPIWYK